MPKHPLSKHIAAFGQQRRDSIRRDIGFKLTFDEWYTFWLASGQLDNRGRRKGQYVMARHGDAGIYILGNVSIILCEQNHRDAAPKMRGIPKSDECKAKLRAFRSGSKQSEETKSKIRKALKGRKLGPVSEATKQKMSAAKLGKPGHPMSALNIKNLREGQKIYWEKRRSAAGKK